MSGCPLQWSYQWFWKQVCIPGRFREKSTIDQGRKESDTTERLIWSHLMQKIATVFRVPESSLAQAYPLCRVPSVISHLGYSQSLPGDLQFTLSSILNTVPSAILSGVWPCSSPVQKLAMVSTPMVSTSGAFRAQGRTWADTLQPRILSPPLSPPPPLQPCSLLVGPQSPSESHLSASALAGPSTWKSHPTPQNCITSFLSCGLPWPFYLKGYHVSPSHWNSSPPSAYLPPKYLSSSITLFILLIYFFTVSFISAGI